MASDQDYLYLHRIIMMFDQDSEPESSIYNTRSSFSIQQLQNHLDRHHTDIQPKHKASDGHRSGIREINTVNLCSGWI